jgi:hypothetical protein
METESELENKKVEAERERLKTRQQNDLRKILNTPEGRRFIWQELSDAGIFRGSFSANASQTAFAEGQRDRGLSLLNRVNEADRNAFARMQQEFLSEAMKTTQPKGIGQTKE